MPTGALTKRKDPGWSCSNYQRSRNHQRHHDQSDGGSIARIRQMHKPVARQDDLLTTGEQQAYNPAD